MMKLARREFLACAGAAAIPASGVFGATASKQAAVSLFRVRPHLQLLTESSVAVVWMTMGKTTGYVTWSQDGWDTIYTAWQETDGLLDANALVHKAVIEGFDPHRRLEYRIHSRPFGKFAPYNVSYSGDEEILNGVMEAILPSDGSVSWAMVNDVHENHAVYERLVPFLNGDASFCTFNGDIINHVDDEEDVVQRLLGSFAKVSQEARLPVWYVRGNHETRGAFARNVRDYLALKDGRYYGALTLGRVRFAFLDTGEDKRDDHREYSGLVAFDRYLETQNAWLTREVSSMEWKNARARIVVRHIPGPLTSQLMLKGWPWRHKLPRLAEADAILKQANVSLCMSANLHHWGWHDATAERPYPMVVGGGPKLGDPQSQDNATLVKCRFSDNCLSVKVLDHTGNVRIDKTLRIEG
jgi:hypothetical protein